MSDAFTGFHCGRLITGGAGKDWHGRASNGRRHVIHHVYGANLGKTPIRPGDSGAPVFTGDGVALGVLFARQAKHTPVASPARSAMWRTWLRAGSPPTAAPARRARWCAAGA